MFGRLVGLKPLSLLLNLRGECLLPRPLLAKKKKPNCSLPFIPSFVNRLAQDFTKIK